MPRNHQRSMFGFAVPLAAAAMLYACGGRDTLGDQFLSYGGDGFGGSGGWITGGSGGTAGTGGWITGGTAGTGGWGTGGTAGSGGWITGGSGGTAGSGGSITGGTAGTGGWITGGSGGTTTGGTGGTGGTTGGTGGIAGTGGTTGGTGGTTGGTGGTTGGTGGTTGGTGGTTGGTGGTTGGTGGTTGGTGGTTGGTGGTTGGTGGTTGGTGGTGGVISLIDDMEDQDRFILPVEGRNGSWAAFNDGTPGATSTYDFQPIARTGSKVALRARGAGNTLWGSGFGFDFHVVRGLHQLYDASNYSGVTFWARVSTGSSQFVRVDLPDVNTVPEGGVCATCWDHFGRWIVLSTSWQRFTFRWDQLSQEGWGDIQPSIDETALYSMQFLLQANVTYTVWIDDVAFWR